jgi:hypothetical protein
VTISQDIRRKRRVLDWKDCRSAGSERLLERGSYVHPRIGDVAESVSTGVLVFKPPARITASTLFDLAERSAECGYVIAEGRLVPTQRIRQHRLARRHYHLHQAIAERGILQPVETENLRRTYDGQEFRSRYGCPPDDVPVLPVYEFLAQSGVPVERINEWSVSCANAHGLVSGSIDGANEVADCKYVNLFDGKGAPAGRPVFLLNAHMPGVIREFEESAHPVVVLRLAAASPAALPWPQVRTVFCGASDPARAVPGSLRRDAYDGVFPLRLESGEAIGRTRNGIHLSDGPLEALREMVIWFECDPERTPIGRALSGGGAIDIRQAIDRPFVSVDGHCQTLKQAARGRTLEQIREMLSRSRLLDVEEPAAEVEPVEGRSHDG